MEHPEDNPPGPGACVSSAFDRATHKYYSRLGRLIGKSPWKFFALGWSVFALLIPGLGIAGGDMWVLVMHLNTDFMDQFAFRDTRFYKDYKYATGVYPPDRGEVILFNPSSGIQVGSPSFMKAGLAVELDIMSGRMKADHDGTKYSFPDVCVHATGDYSTTDLDSCEVFSAFRMLINDTYRINVLPTVDDSLPAADFVAQLLPALHPVLQWPLLQLFVGETSSPWPGPTANASQVGQWFASAKASQTFFKLQQRGKTKSGQIQADVSRTFEFRIQEYLEEDSDKGVLRLSGMMEMSAGKEQAMICVSALPLVAVVIVIMVVYASVFLGTQTRKRGQSQYLLIGCAAGIPGIAAFSAMGFMGYVGLDLNVISVLVPFLGLACGIDAIFVFMSAMRSVPRKRLGDSAADMPELMAEVLSDGGAAISVTSLTSIFAFLVAAVSSTNFPGACSFNILLSVTMLLNWFGFLVIFPSMIVLNERRIAAGRRDLMPWKMQKAVQESEYNSEENSKVSKWDLGTRLRSFCVHRYAPQLRNSFPFKAAGAVFMLGLIGASIPMAAQISRGMPDRYFVIDSSYFMDLFKDLEANFDNRARLEVFLFLPEPDLRNAVYMSTLQHLMGNLTARKDICMGFCWPLMGVTSPVSSWLDSHPMYKRDARLSSNDTIQSARCTVFVDQVMEAATRGEQTHDLVDMVDKSGLNALLYHASFPIHVGRYDKMKGTVLTSCALAVGAVFVALLLSLPVHLALIASLNVLCVVTVLFGFMGLAGITFNAISFAVCIMAIGFCVDYTCHVCHFSNHGMTPGTPWKERMASSIEACGYDVFHGCATAFIGVCFLTFGGSQAFRIFGFMSMVITLVGGSFALFGLPSLLVILDGCRRGNGEDNVKTVQVKQGIGYKGHELT